MNVEFYKTTDDPKKLDKTMSSIGSGATTLTAPVNNTAATVSLLRPSFVLASNTLYFTATHVKVPDMGGRWYFIDNITLLTGGKMQIDCSIDVLKTYAAQIATAPCCITRNENIGINWVPDDKLPYNTEITFTQPTQGQFSTPFTRSPDNPWILTVINDSDTVYPTP